MFRSISVIAVLLISFSGINISFAADKDEYATLAPLAKHSLLIAASTTPDLLVVAGERGHILYSNDGKDWQQANVPTRAMLTGITMLDSSTGWAVGHDAVILKTVDGAKNWTKVYSDIELEAPLLDLLFLDNDNGIAIGAYGLYLVTHDGGASWQQIGFNTILKSDDASTGEEEDFFDFHLNDIEISENGNLYIAAEAGNIFRSTDKGASWSALSSPYQGSFFGILPTDQNTLLVFGLRGHLYRSTDDGTSWSAIDSGTTEMLTSGVMVDNHIILSATGGVYLVSQDKGETFQVRSLDKRQGISSIKVIDENTLLLVGEFGVKTLPKNKIVGH